MSKYLPLANYLRSLRCNEAELTFQQIESIIESSLPKSAKKHPAFWANSRTKDSHKWAHHWIEAGWQVKKLAIDEQKVIFTRITKFEYFDIDNEKAIEGYEIDAEILKYSRNANLARKRKEFDNYQCQACSFRLEVNGKWIIEVHHLNPLNSTGKIVNSLDELVSLCPTCHRIAHTRNVPYEISEIKKLRK